MIFHADGNEKKKSWDSNTYIKQSRLKNKGYKKRQKRTSHIQ